MVADTLLHADPPLPRRGRVPAWAWAGFVGVVGAATPVYYFLPIETQSLVDNVIAVASAVAMFAGIVWNRPTPRFAWVLLASGVLLFAAGDIAYGTSQPVPSPADMLYVSAYPLLGLGLLILARARLPGPNNSTALDAIIVAAGVAIVALVFLAVPAGQERDVGTITRLISIGYPILDLALLIVLVRPMRSATARGLPALLMGVALLLRLVGDVGFVLLNYGTSYTVGNAADAAWLLSFGCFGAALLHRDIALHDALLRPSGSIWTSVPASWGVATPQLDSSTVVLRGLSGDAVAVSGFSGGSAAVLGNEQRTASIAWGQALRFRLILIWTGLLLLGLAGVAMITSMTWGTPEVALVAGAYGIVGSLTLIAGAIRP
jgi:hypothetical protein